MIKLGVIFCGYNCDEHVAASLPIWEFLKKKMGDNLTFTVCNCLFEEYADMGQKVLPLAEWAKADFIDFCHHNKWPVSEAVARGECLKFLLTKDIDFVLLVDADEFYTKENFDNIVKFVENNEFITWFKLSLKNYVFDNKTYLTDPFTPPRIFKVLDGDYELDSFSWDNDVVYRNTFGNKVPHSQFSSITIPKNIAWINHYSWCGAADYLRDKVAYQLAHFNGVCSYRWDDKENRLKFNEDFFEKYRLAIPKIAKD